MPGDTGLTAVSRLGAGEPLDRLLAVGVSPHSSLKAVTQLITQPVMPAQCRFGSEYFHIPKEFMLGRFRKLETLV